MDEEYIHGNLIDGDKFESSFGHEGGFYGNPEDADENMDTNKAVLGAILILLNIPIALNVFMLLMLTFFALMLPILLVGNGFSNMWAKDGWLLPVFIVNLFLIIKGYIDDKKYFTMGYIITFISYYYYIFNLIYSY